jgi:hypothetical protein
MLFVMAKKYVGIVYSALGVGLLTFAVAVLALIYLEETFKKDINYIEEEYLPG